MMGGMNESPGSYVREPTEPDQLGGRSFFITQFFCLGKAGVVTLS